MATFDAIYGFGTADKYLIEDNYSCGAGMVFAMQKISADPYVVVRKTLSALRLVGAVTGRSIIDELSVITCVRKKTIAAIHSRVYRSKDWCH